MKEEPKVSHKPQSAELKSLSKWVKQYAFLPLLETETIAEGEPQTTISGVKDAQ